MQAKQDETESSPLLKDVAQNGSPDQEETTQGDAEVGPNEAIEDPEILQGRKTVKRFLPILGLGIFLAFLDQSIIAAINGDIGNDLHALKNVSWIATAYFLTMAASQPLYGKLSDVFGRKPCLLFAYAMFAIGSLACGFAGSIASLIAGRAIQGIGGGGMLIVVTVVLSDFINLRERGTYQAYLNLIGALGSVSGGPVGGLFVQSIGWRWLFLIQVILCLIAIGAVSLFLHLPIRKSELPWTKQLPRIDFLGAALLILAIFGLLYGLDQGSNGSWLSPMTLIPLCATVPLTVVFLWVEARFAHEPFTPAHVIFDKALFACYMQNFFGYGAFTALIIYLPMFFQFSRLNMTPAAAGASLIPGALSAVVGTLLGGVVLKRTGRFYWLAVFMSTTATLSSILFPLAPSLHHYALLTTYIGSVASFISQGMVITASLIAILSNVSATDQAVSTACMFLFRALGGAVGTSLVGTLIQLVLKLRLRANLSPKQAEDVIREIARSMEYIKDLPPSMRVIVQDCYSGGIQAGFLLCVALLVVANLSVFWWREKKL